MNGRIVSVLALVILCSLYWPVFASQHSGQHDYVYICGCAMSVGCQTAFDQPGKCPCGKTLFKKKVIREDKSYFYVTRSAEPDSDCSVDPQNISRCLCGKELYALAKNNHEKAFKCISSGGCNRREEAHQ